MASAIETTLKSAAGMRVVKSLSPKKRIGKSDHVELERAVAHRIVLIAVARIQACRMAQRGSLHRG